MFVAVVLRLRHMQDGSQLALSQVVILGSSIGMAADKKKAALQQEDGKVTEIMELFVNLPADKQQEALSYLRYLSASADK